MPDDWETRMGKRARARRLAQEAERDEAYAREEHIWPKGFACACIGSLVEVLGAPCRCEMLKMAQNLREARARGEEPDWLKLGWHDR